MSLAPAFSVLDSDKELFPCAASVPARQTLPTNAIIDPRLTTAAFGDRKSKIENRKFTSLRDLRRMRTVFLKDPRRRKFAEFMPNHVFGDKHGNEGLPVVNQKRVADKIRRNHRTPRPGFDRFFSVRAVHLVDLFQKMRLDEGSFL